MYDVIARLEYYILIRAKEIIEAAGSNRKDDVTKLSLRITAQSKHHEFYYYFR